MAVIRCGENLIVTEKVRLGIELPKGGAGLADAPTKIVELAHQAQFSN